MAVIRRGQAPPVPLGFGGEQSRGCGKGKLDARAVFQAEEEDIEEARAWRGVDRSHQVQYFVLFTALPLCLHPTCGLES